MSSFAQSRPDTTDLDVRFEPARALYIACAIMIVIGVGAFIGGVTGEQAQRAWQAYLINFLFWSGLSFGSVLFVAILNMTNARWARPMKRLAEAPSAFLPVSFVLFWVIYFGKDHLFVWIREPVHGKEAWLSAGFLFARDGFGLLVLIGLSLALVYFSVKADRYEFGDPASEKAWKMQGVLSPIVGVCYAVVLSLIAFDLVMSLDPHWYSTLFGAYFFVGCFYTALAALIVLTEPRPFDGRPWGRFCGRSNFTISANSFSGFAF